MVIIVDKCKESGPGSGKWCESNDHSNVERDAGAELLIGPEKSVEADLSKTQRN